MHPLHLTFSREIKTRVSKIDWPSENIQYNVPQNDCCNTPLYQRLCKQHKYLEQVQSKHIGDSKLRPINPDRSCSDDAFGMFFPNECNGFQMRLVSKK